ncbi:MAG: hypothetical protein H0T46_02650 [Deltaproteobacteria bacterium]|nr:hypothetical protein [Deltaproteobacteria bacterium]
MIEGWIQDEGRHKVLTVAVREAATGNEIDSVSVKLSQKGLSPENKTKLQTELDGVLEYIEGSPELGGSNLRVIETRKMIGAKPSRADEEFEIDPDADEAEEASEEPAMKKKKDVATTVDAKDNQDLVYLFGEQSDEGRQIDPKAAHVPVATPRFRIAPVSRRASFRRREAGPAVVWAGWARCHRNAPHRSRRCSSRRGAAR